MGNHSNINFLPFFFLSIYFCSLHQKPFYYCLEYPHSKFSRILSYSFPYASYSFYCCVCLTYSFSNVALWVVLPVEFVSQVYHVCYFFYFLVSPPPVPTTFLFLPLDSPNIIIFVFFTFISIFISSKYSRSILSICFSSSLPFPIIAI